MSCTCVSCYLCGGSGHFWTNLRGQLVVHCDDMDIMELCEDCGGDGIVEICEECVYDRDETE